MVYELECVEVLLALLYVLLFSLLFSVVFLSCLQFPYSEYVHVSRFVRHDELLVHEHTIQHWKRKNEELEYQQIRNQDREIHQNDGTREEHGRKTGSEER